MATARRQITTPEMDIFRDDQVPPRGLIAQLGTLLIQPGEFFRTLTPAHRNRRWLWVAMLILVAVSLSAIQRSGQATSSGDAAPPMEMPVGPGGPPFDGSFSSEGPAPSGDQAYTSDTWTTAIKSMAIQISHWIVLALVLAEVTMFNGRAPRIGANLQIVIWASMPLALMAIVQMIYLGGGGSIGKPGLSGFLEAWEAFAGMNIHIRSFLHGLASNLTLFGLWSLALTYIAARQVLQGKRPVVIAAIVMWIVVLGIGSGAQSYRDFSAVEMQAQSAEMVPLMSLDSGGVAPDDMSAPSDMQGEHLSELEGAGS